MPEVESQDKLADALEQEGLLDLAERAYNGDFSADGPLDDPKGSLCRLLRRKSKLDMIQRIRAGEFD